MLHPSFSSMKLMQLVGTEVLDWAADTALCWREEARRPEQVLALTTCSSAFTDARTVVLAAIWQEG